MRKDKGFTLIELLAVIVILAIIALIAVPVIMNIISKARKSAFEDTAYGLISAGEMYYAEMLLEPTGMTQDKVFTMSGGVFTSTESLNVSGSIPNGSVGVTTDGKVAIAINNGINCITKGYNDTNITTSEYTEGACTLPALPAKTLAEVTTTANACTAKDTTCAVGTQFAIKVNASETYNFRVIKDDGNNVTLLMEENLGGTVAWITEAAYGEAGGTAWSDWSDNNAFGPMTALTELESRTAGWTNIAAKTYTVEDENDVYDAITRTNARARMLTYTEANGIVSSANPWSYGNLYTDDTPDLAYGYWTSSADADTPGNAWYVFRSGNVGSNSVILCRQLWGAPGYRNLKICHLNLSIYRSINKELEIRF